MASNFKQANINITLKNLFLQWLDITRSFHKLSGKQMEILALFLYKHYLFKQEVTNEKLLWSLVFDYSVKMEIKNELNIKDAVFQNYMSQLRKKGIIKNNTISSVYIPELDPKVKNFKVIFNYSIV